MRKLIYACLAAGMVACGTDNKSEEAPRSYPVASPVMIDTLYPTEYVAEIHSLQNVEIRTRVKGYLEKIHVDEGATVRKGQLLFSLSSQLFREELMKYRAQVKIAQAEARKAELEYQNVKLLFEKNVVSSAELQKSAAQLEALRARVEESRSLESSALLHLAQTEIRAPFDGVISRFPFKAGSLVDEGALLTTISNNREVYAYFNVSEREYLNFISKKGNKKSDEVRLVLANNEMFGYPGLIETVDGEMDKSTGNIAFRAKFPNPDQWLKHGSSGRIQVMNELKKALVIPQKATFEIQDKVYVFVVDSANRVKSRNIGISLRLPHLYVVDRGLGTGDRILLEGIQTVKDNDRIKPEVMTVWQAIQAQTVTEKPR